jgi:hypothetical protein
VSKYQSERDQAGKSSTDVVESQMNEQNHRDNFDVPKVDERDAVYAIAKGLISTVPFAGGVAGELFGLEPQHHRVRNVFSADEVP